MGLRGPGARPLPAQHIKRVVRRRRTKLWTNSTRTERVIEWIEKLPITSGVFAGTKFKLRDWQKEILRGIYRTDDEGKRVVRQAVITMPRKNGKTGLTAALGLAHLCGPEAEPRGQIYSAAADRNQAALIYSEMKAIINEVPELRDRVIIRDFTKHLEDVRTGSTFQSLSSESKTKHGFNASCIIIDELAQLPDRKLYDVLTTSTAARAEPLTIVISTQSSDPHSIMSELVDYGIQVRDGVMQDPTFYPVIYTAPEGADPWDEKVWAACNPALDDFRSLQEMRSAALQAQRIPAREATFRLLYLNQRVAAEAAFIAQADWEACGGEVNPESLRGRPCYAGLDLSSTTDLTSLVLFFPDDGGAVLPYFWVPSERLDEREHTDKVPYRLWEKQGFLEAPTGRAIDRLAIARRVAEITNKFDLKGLAYDRWRAEDLEKLLNDQSIELQIVKWGQGFQDMGPAVDVLESRILNGTIRHPKNPILSWNLSNSVIEIDSAGARKISKRRSRERVDGMVALVMAVGLHSKMPDEKPVQFFVLGA